MVTITPKKQFSRPCVVCDADDFEVLNSYIENVPTSNGKYSFDINEGICRCCGLVYTNPVPDDGFLNAYYKSKFLYNNGELDYDLEKRLSYLKQVRGTRKRLMEFGSGEGSFLRAAEAIGMEAVGIEPNDNAEASLLSHVAENELYDIVVSNHVLEHIADPLSFLKEIKNHMSTDGLLLFEVPNLHQYDTYDTAVFFEHLFHFSPANLSHLLAKAGFELVEFEYENISRPIGFVILAKPSENVTTKPLPQEYKKNHRYFLQALSNVKARCQRYDDFAKKIIPPSDKKLVFWGANTVLLELLKRLPEECHDSIIVVDANKTRWGNLVDEAYSLKVSSPESLQTESDIETFVICAIDWADQIEESLTGMGFQKSQINVSPYS